MQLQEIKLSIIVLGFVGLPVAGEFGGKRAVISFDIKQHRIDDAFGWQRHQTGFTNQHIFKLMNAKIDVVKTI